VFDAFDRPLLVKALALRNLQPEPGGGGKGPKGGLACVSLAQGRDQVFAQSWQDVLASAAEEEEAGPPDVAINLPDLIQPKKLRDSARTVKYPAASLLFFGFMGKKISICVAVLFLCLLKHLFRGVCLYPFGLL
jgi:hypothetical protein